MDTCSMRPTISSSDPISLGMSIDRRSALAFVTTASAAFRTALDRGQ
jgi:hypothetical protein